MKKPTILFWSLAALGVSSCILLFAVLALIVSSYWKREPSAPETPTSASPVASVGDKEREQFLEFQARAGKGDAIAQYKLGRCYLKGEGVAKDEVEAVKWFRVAADGGHIFAQYQLGVCYGQGQGVAKDEVEAMKWYLKAGDKGDVFAQHDLGRCYAEGLGVAKDEVEAYKWYLLAAAKGKSEAKVGADMVKGMMSAAQIAEGEQRAEQWRAQNRAKSDNGGK
jgi:TPR repeat protein